MKDTLTELEKFESCDLTGPCVGSIVQITSDGKLLVDFAGNFRGPLEARSIVDPNAMIVGDCWKSSPVLLIFERDNRMRPIIVGIVRDTVCASANEEAEFDTKHPRDVFLDGRRLALYAEDEIVLRCGRSSIILRRDGRILVKGTEIISRSSGAHKIQGASIKLN